MHKFMLCLQRNKSFISTQRIIFHFFHSMLIFFPLFPCGAAGGTAVCDQHPVWCFTDRLQSSPLLEEQREVLYPRRFYRWWWALGESMGWEWKSLRHLQKTHHSVDLYSSHPGKIGPFSSFFVLPKCATSVTLCKASFIILFIISVSSKSRHVPGWPQLCPRQTPPSRGTVSCRYSGFCG